MEVVTRQRVWNFSAGPATLPLPVLQQMQEELLSYGDSGESVMEMSHRSSVFLSIYQDAISRLRGLLGLSDDYEVLFLQGGGRLQNLMVPMNLLEGKDSIADYVVTGAWGKYSSEDAKNYGQVQLAWSGQEAGFRGLPEPAALRLSPQASYLHLTSNETIHGVQFPRDCYPGLENVVRIGDFSSDFLSRPLDISQFGLIYACAQKNAGIAGLTVVLIRKDILERTAGRVPGYLSYAAHAAADGMYNTVPTFAIYVTGLVCRWLSETIGGLEEMERVNRLKAHRVYEALDQFPEFYRVHANEDCRSLMNICFTTASPQLDKNFSAEAKLRGMSDLQGHRSVGGIRASLYNAMPLEGAEALREFIIEFANQHG